MEINFTEKQKEYIRKCNQKKYNFKTGATGSGKTFLDFAYIIPMRINDKEERKRKE